MAAPQDFTASLWDEAFRPKVKREACLLVVWVLSGLFLGLLHRGKQLANFMVGKLTCSQFLSLWFPRTGKDRTLMMAPWNVSFRLPVIDY